MRPPWAREKRDCTVCAVQGPKEETDTSGTPTSRRPPWMARTGAMRPLRMTTPPSVLKALPTPTPVPPKGDARDTSGLTSSEQAVVREAIRRYDLTRRLELIQSLCTRGKTLAAARVAAVEAGLPFIDDPKRTEVLPLGYSHGDGDRYAKYKWTTPPDAIVNLIAHGTIAELRAWLFANTDASAVTPHFVSYALSPRGPGYRGGVVLPKKGLDFGWFEAVRSAIENLSIAEGLVAGSLWFCPTVKVSGLDDGHGVGALTRLHADDLIPALTGIRTECPCKRTSRLLYELNAKHAAKMHLTPSSEWTVTDERDHANDEETILFPIIRIVAGKYDARGMSDGRELTDAVDLLIAEHRLFEADCWSKGLHAPAEKWAAHGALEERLMEKYEGPIRLEAGLPIVFVETDTLLRGQGNQPISRME